MTLKKAHLYLFPLKSLTNMMLKGILLEAGGKRDEPEPLARALGWKAKDVEQFLKHGTAPEVEGPDAVSMSLSDLRGKTRKQAILVIENVIVMRAFEEFRAMSVGEDRLNRFVAKLLGTKEWYIRRVIKRVEEMRSAGSAAQPSDQKHAA